MYCRNCGNSMDPKAVVCVKCGAAAGDGTNYCPYCGAETRFDANVGTQCGNPLAKPVDPSTQKSRMVAGLLGILLGGLGAHNFYLGNNSRAILQIVLNLCCGAGAIWGLIEGIMILTGSINTDAWGVPLKD